MRKWKAENDGRREGRGEVRKKKRWKAGNDGGGEGEEESKARGRGLG